MRVPTITDQLDAAGYSDPARLRDYLERERGWPASAVAFAEAQGVRWVSDRRGVKIALDVPVSDSFARPGVVFPFHQPNGAPIVDGVNGKPFARLRPEFPMVGDDGKARKYLARYGTTNHLFIPLGALELAQRLGHVVLVEGEFKALILMANGVPAIAVTGVDNWKKARKERELQPDGSYKWVKRAGVPIEDLGLVPWREITCFIAYDSDVQDNPNVHRAEDALAVELRGRGAKVMVCRIPSDKDSEGKETKNGADDYILRHGLEAWKDVIATAKPHQRRRIWTEPSQKTTAKPATPDVEAIVNDTRQDVRAILLKPDGRLHVFSPPAGAGKSSTLDEVLADMEGAWPTVKRHPLRVVVLVKTHHEVAQHAEKIPHAFVVQGRSDDPESEFYCVEKARIDRLAAGRHPINEDVCKPCLAKHREVEPDWVCPYLRSMQEAEEARTVTAPYGSYLNEGKRISAFDVVVVDESLPENLVEENTVTEAHLAAWQRIVSQEHHRYPRGCGVRRVLDLLGQVLTAGRAQSDVHQRADAGEKYLELAGDDLPIIMPEDEDGRRFLFENAHLRDKTGPIAPRMMADLQEALLAEDGRAHLTRAGITFCRPKEALLEQLRGKTIINLDATPCVPLLREIFPDAVIHGEFNPAANVTITQVPERMNTVSTLIKPEKKGSDEYRQIRDLEQMVGMIACKYEKPLIVGKKRIIDGEPAPDKLNVDHPGARLAWFGNQTRGSNDYLDCDALIIAGDWQAPPDAVERMVNALRRSTPVRGTTTCEPRQYEVIGATEGTFRDMHIHPDPLVQAVIEHTRMAEMVQAIGRLRAIRRLEPLPVYILSGAVVAGLPIDRLMPQAELLGDRTQRAHITEINAKRKEKAEAKIRTAIAEGVTGRNAIARAAGVDPKVVTVFLRAEGMLEAGGGHTVVEDITNNDVAPTQDQVIEPNQESESTTPYAQLPLMLVPLLGDLLTPRRPPQGRRHSDEEWGAPA